MELNQAQRKAIAISDGPLLIIAGPGTGKTRVLVSKIESLLQQKKISPERILAITFSNKATEEMRERLAVSIKGIADNIEVSTIHAWCTEVVRRHAFRLGFEKNPQLMSESQAQIYFRQVLEQLPLQDLFKTAHSEALSENVLEIIGKAKDQGLWPEDLIQYGHRLLKIDPASETGKNWLSIGEIYNSFHSFCFSKGFMDFGDSLLFALRLLQDHGFVREDIQKTYDAILVDEFQDTNWTQVEILRLMASPEAHVCAVGDDDQAIYGFRGASYAAFQFFQQAFPQLQIVELNETYRLSEEIADAATCLIQANGAHRFLPEKKIQARGGKHGPVQVLVCPTYEDEALEVTERIRVLIESGTSPGQIAILTRAHSHAYLFLDEAERKNIPIQTVSSESIWDDPLVQDVLSYLRLLQEPRNNVDFLRLADSPFIAGAEDDIFLFCRWAADKFRYYIDALEKISESPCSTVFKESLEIFYTHYKSARGHLARKSLSEIIFDFLADTSFVKKFLASEESHVAKVSRLLSQISEWEKIQDRRDTYTLLPLLERLLRNAGSLEELQPEKDPNRVAVATIHASKGLEFDHVFVLSLVGRRFPSNFKKSTWEIPQELRHDEAMTPERHREEERRLLYVAMTRARMGLYLSTVEKRNTKPSSFITDDLKGCSSIRTISVPSRPPEEIFKPRPPKGPFQRQKRFEGTRPTQVSLRLSFTQMDTYERCPQAYQFRFDFQIPTRESPSLVFGTCVHSALETLFKSLKTEVPVSKEQLIEAFEKQYRSQMISNPQLPETHVELGKRQLSAFYDQHDGRWPKTIAVEEKFAIKVGDHVVSGKIDRVDQLENGEVRIVDYKTGTAKSSSKERDQAFADESLQFSIYALAAEEIFKWRVRDLSFYYLSEQTELSTTRSTVDLTKTKDRIKKIAEGILNRNFLPQPSNVTCKNCDFVRICPANPEI